MFACSPISTATQGLEWTVQPTSAETDHPLTTRTGNEEIDHILDVVANGDAQALQSLTQFTNAKCTKQDGLGSPPKCRAGEAEGTPVEVLPFLGPEGNFLHKEEIDQLRYENSYEYWLEQHAQPA